MPRSRCSRAERCGGMSRAAPKLPRNCRLPFDRLRANGLHIPSVVSQPILSEAEGNHERPVPPSQQPVKGTVGSIRLLVALLFALLLVAACGDDDNGSQPSASPSATARLEPAKLTFL